MKLELEKGVVNKPLGEDAARSLFTRPNNLGTNAIDLATFSTR
jgi:hypothetical protein